MEEPKVELNQVVEACMKQLQALQANKRQSEQLRFARKRLRCWCCGEKGHLLRACPVVQQNRAAYCKQKAENRGCQRGQIGTVVAPALAKASDLIFVTVSIAGVEVVALVDTSALRPAAGGNGTRNGSTTWEP